MRATGTTALCAGPSQAWGSAMWLPSWRPLKCAMCARMIRSRHVSASKPWRSACPSTPGAPSRGGKARTRSCSRALPVCGLVDLAKMRWRIERDYEDLKQEIGLGHYEGRRWRGFHHHGTLSIAAYGFLISERERIPPSGPRSATPIEKYPLPSDYRPRGAPDPAAATHSQLDRHDPSCAGPCDCKGPSAMPVLPAPPSAQPEMEFMTQ